MCFIVILNNNNIIYLNICCYYKNEIVFDKNGIFIKENILLEKDNLHYQHVIFYSYNAYNISIKPYNVLLKYNMPYKNQFDIDFRLNKYQLENYYMIFFIIQQKQNNILKYCSNEFKKNEELVLQALKYDENALDYIDNNLLTNENFILQGIENMKLNYKLKNNKKFIL